MTVCAIARTSSVLAEVDVTTAVWSTLSGPESKRNTGQTFDSKSGAGYKQEQYDEISNKMMMMMMMMIKVGCMKDFVDENTSVLPIAVGMGGKLLKKSDVMPLWKGCNMFVDTTAVSRGHLV